MRLLRIKVIYYSISSYRDLQQVTVELQFLLFNIPCFNHLKVGFWNLSELNVRQHALFCHLEDG